MENDIKKIINFYNYKNPYRVIVGDTTLNFKTKEERDKFYRFIFVFFGSKVERDEIEKDESFDNMDSVYRSFNTKKF